MKPAAAAGLVLLAAVLIPRATTHDRAAVGNVAFAQSSPAPEAPRTFVKVNTVASPARTIHVPAGHNLQAAIDGARAGDVITLDPGAVYRGPFHLRRTDGDGWIVITSSAADDDLPDAGERVQARHWTRMPKLVSATDAGHRRRSRRASRPAARSRDRPRRGHISADADRSG